MTPWTITSQACLFLTISQNLPKFISIASVMLFSHLILWCPLHLLASIFPSFRDFFNELAVHIRWPKYRSFSPNISHSNEYSGLFPFKIDWFDLPAAQGTLKESSTTIQRHLFFVALPSLWSNAHNNLWPLGRPFVIAQSCPTLCDPMNCSTPGFPVLHHLLEFA